MDSFTPLYVAGVCRSLTEDICCFELGFCDAIGSPIWVTGRTGKCVDSYTKIGTELRYEKSTCMHLCTLHWLSHESRSEYVTLCIPSMYYPKIRENKTNADSSDDITVYES